MFERLRVYGGRVFRLEGHVARLFASARSLGAPLSHTPAAVAQALTRAVADRGLREATVRVGVPRTRPRGPSDLQIIVEPVPNYPAAWYREGMVLATVPLRAHPPAAQDPKVKSQNRLAHVLATTEAAARGALDALFVTRDGYVAEGTTSNVFIVRGGALCTPPLWLGVLDGVTRSVVMDLARGLGVTVREQPFTRVDCYTAEEMFLTNTTMEIVPVRQLDGREIGVRWPGPLTRRLRAAFSRAVRQEGAG